MRISTTQGHLLGSIVPQKHDKSCGSWHFFRFWSLMVVFGHFRPRNGRFGLLIPVFGRKNGHFFDFFNKKVFGTNLGGFRSLLAILGSKNRFFGQKPNFSIFGP